MLAASPLVTPRNRILNALPFEEFNRISPKLKHIEMPLGEILYTVGEPINYVYFPENSVISTINYFEDGSSLETGITGSEGMTGVGVALSSDTAQREASVQASGEAWQMSTEDFRFAFKTNMVFQHLVLRYVFAFFEQVAQSGACVNTHPISRRLARWLLMCHDRSEGDDLYLTQDFMAQMLGVNRPSLTVAAIHLRDEGLIKYSRGTVTIQNRSKLEHASCECYSLIRKIYDHYLSLVELRQMNRRLDQLTQKMNIEAERRREIQRKANENKERLQRVIKGFNAPPVPVRVCKICHRFCDYRKNPAIPDEILGKQVTAEFYPIVCTDCRKS